MLAVFARQFNSLSLRKAAGHLGLSSLLLLVGAGSVHDATALNETRTLSFHHTHSDEDLTVTFKRDGRYDEESLKQLNHFLRDWRSQDEIVMDRHLFDIIWEVYRDVDGKRPIQIISAYRSPATNAMLRRRSSGVARFSQHMLGHAMDFFIPDVPLEQIRYAGLRLQRGGVGFYPTSGSPFVHLDTGSIRHWPRMTHDQLAKVFPDGRTVHVPSDGAPLGGYELAKADIERRGTGDAAATIGKSNLFARLFGGNKSNDEDEDATTSAVVNAQPAARAPASTKLAEAKATDPVPVPRAKPQIASALRLASADAEIVQPAKVRQQAGAEKAATQPQSVTDIINARGFWDDAPKQATPAQVAAISARRALASADPQAKPNEPTVYQALAYAPAPGSSVDRANSMTSSAQSPRSGRLSLSSQRLAQASETDTAVPKTALDKTALDSGSPPTSSARIAAGRLDDIWMRIVLLAPSASTSMSVTTLGDTDLTFVRAFFVKPTFAIAMGFSDDPMMGMSCDHFSGSATTKLRTTSFTMRTAALN